MGKIHIKQRFSNGAHRKKYELGVHNIIDILMVHRTVRVKKRFGISSPSKLKLGTQNQLKTKKDKSYCHNATSIFGWNCFTNQCNDFFLVFA